MQVFGGHGYVHDSGMEHFVRNARIGQIYEGANGIQAMDLVGRRLTAHGGRALRSFAAAVRESITTLAIEAQTQATAQALADGLEHLLAAVRSLQQHAATRADAAGAAAYDLLTMFGILTVGWAWADVSAVPTAHASKRSLAGLWFGREMPLLAALRARIESGPGLICDWADDAI
jgi:hypothetical protein